MLDELKGMIVVLAIAWCIFRAARPIALRFCEATDYDRRRNIWLTLTAVGFLSPSFWGYVVVAVPLMVWVARKDPNPVAIYLLLLQVVPPVEIDIPVVGINTLFALSNYRLLSFCVLIPSVLRLGKSKAAERPLKLTFIELLLLGYGVIQTLQVPPNTSITALLRGAFLYYIDVFLVYYVARRYCINQSAIVDSLAAFFLSCAVMSAIAVFEAARHWLPYTAIKARWIGYYSAYDYLLRGDTLRAEASAGHSLALGVTLAIGFGCWLYIATRLESRRMRLAGGAAVWAGLVAAYSRAPWLAALAIYFCFISFGPRPLWRVLRGASVVALTGLAILASPMGDRFKRVLPFLGGSVDSGGFDYRQRLAQRSWELFQVHPFFGDPLVLTHLEDLRQGQGIIDFVNGYAYIGLFYGGVGLALFVGAALGGLSRVYAASRSMERSSDAALLGAGLMATLLGELLMIGTSGFGVGPEKVFYVMVAIAAGYGQAFGTRYTGTVAGRLAPPA